jgi:hypothetical protein
MPNPASGWTITRSSMFNVRRHCTLLGIGIAPHFLSVTGFKFGRRVRSFVAFEAESVTASFSEKSHPAGLTRSYLNTGILLNPVDYFHCPTALLYSPLRDLYLRIRVLHFTAPTLTLTFPGHIFVLSDLETKGDVIRVVQIGSATRQVSDVLIV